MFSLSPSLLGDTRQVASTGSQFTPSASVEGLPHNIHQIQTLLETVKGFPEDLQSLTPEQTGVLGELINSLGSPAGMSLFDQHCDQESEDE